MERNTHQQKVILDTIAKLSGQHPTADAIYDKVKEQIPTISRATVYRILNRIAERGSLLRIPVPAAADRYDDRTDEHYHMRCTCCGEVLDIDSPHVKELSKKIIHDAYEYNITGFDIVFKGLCKNCIQSHAQYNLPCMAN